MRPLAIVVIVETVIILVALAIVAVALESMPLAIAYAVLCGAAVGSAGWLYEARR